MTDREKLSELIYSMDICSWVWAEKIADHLISNGVAARKWIPVTERLPVQGQEVIVYTGGVLKPCVMGYFFWNPEYDSWARVTHWMELPEPPKEE